MADTRMESWTHHDAQDDEAIIGCYADIGFAPGVVFDGGCFTDADALLAYAADLASAAQWLRSFAPRTDTEPSS